MSDDGTEQKNKIRAQISEADPFLLDVLDECRRVFGARLIACKTANVTLGRWEGADAEYRGIVPPPPARSYQQQLEDWRQHVQEVEARAGSYRGAAFRKLSRGRR